MIAIASYSFAQKTPVESKSVSAITITDLNGAEYSFAREDEAGNEMIDFFMKMNDAAKKVDLPEPLRGSDTFNITYFSYNIETDYKYYFSADPKEAYYVNEKGEAYKINEKYAEEFLISDYANSVYPAAKRPILSLSQKTVNPDSISWKYLNCKNEYTDAVLSADGNENNFVVMSALSLGFNVEPDYLSITLKNGDETLYSGLYEELTSDSLKYDTELQATVEAKWYENIVRGSNGEAIYNFKVTITSPPAFYLGETSLLPGEFVAITGANVSDISLIEFSSVPEINYTPVFFRDGEYVRALVPISVQLEDHDKYDFTIKIGDFTQTMTLNMEDKTFKSQTYDISSAKVNSARSDAALKEFDDVIGPLLLESDPTKYFDGTFLQLFPDNKIKTGFGLYRTIKVTKEMYRHEGVDYYVAATDTARAVNAGKVIYTGELALSGKTVLVEHGWGLKSIYAHLSDISVSVGDTVAHGDVLGTAGSTGFTDGLLMHTGLYLFGVPVCPYNLWETGVVMTNP